MEDEKKDIKKNNTVAEVLQCLAVFIGAFGFLIALGYIQNSVLSAIIIIGIIIISAILMYAFGEVIELLQDIKNKL